MQWILSCCIAWGAQPVICDDLAGSDGKKGIMYICTYNRFMTLQKLTQHCKAIILQQEINKVNWDGDKNSGNRDPLGRNLTNNTRRKTQKCF